MFQRVFVLCFLVSCAGAPGPAGADGNPCTSVNNGDGSYTISCPNSEPVTIRDGTGGAAGADGDSCSAEDNGDGSYTISCPGSDPITIQDGAAGANGENGSTGENGQNGADGEPCTAEANEDGSYTIRCPDSEPIIVRNGETGQNGEDGQNGADGDDCSAEDNGDGTLTIRCGDQEPVTVRLPRCGDGVVSGGEECDDANLSNDDACTILCLNARCGDGVLWRRGLEPDDPNYEECDDGNDSNEDECINACIPAICGDGFAQTGEEECDDGNPTEGDGCDSNCTATSCGNGVITEGEECDDGNLNNLDECTNDCQRLARDCGSHLRRGETENGVYDIDPDAGGDDEAYSVYCEQETNGGGWTRAIVVTKDELLWDAWTTRRPRGGEGERAGPLQDFSDDPDGLDLEYMFRVDDGAFYERTFRSVHRSAWDPDFGGSFAPDGFEFAANFGGPWTRCSHDLNHHNASYNWVISHYPEGNVPLCASQINGYSFTITGDNNTAGSLNGLGDPANGARGNGRDENWSRVEVFVRRPPVCGDGIQQGDETCDDGNVDDGDGCPADCRVARSCADVADSPSGLYEFPGTLRGGQSAELYCDNDEDEGGWTLVGVARFGQHGGDWVSDGEINPQHVGSLTEHWHLGTDLINLLAVNGEYRVNCFESANNYTRYWHGVDSFRWSALTRLDYSWAGYGQTGERFVADQSGGQWYGLASGAGETSVVILSHAGGHWACGGNNGPGGEGYTGRGGRSSYRLWVR